MCMDVGDDDNDAVDDDGYTFESMCVCSTNLQHRNQLFHSPCITMETVRIGNASKTGYQPELLMNTSFNYLCGICMSEKM